MSANELEASVKAVAVVAEWHAQTLSKSLSQLSVLAFPVRSTVEKATNVVSGVQFGQSE